MLIVELWKNIYFNFLGWLVLLLLLGLSIKGDSDFYGFFSIIFDFSLEFYGLNYLKLFIIVFYLGFDFWG